MKATLSLALASCLSCAVSPAAPSPRAGDVIIEDTDTPPSPNPGAEDKAKKGVRFVSLTPDILYEVDPSRYVENPRTLAGAQLFYGARPDLLPASPPMTPSGSRNWPKRRNPSSGAGSTTSGRNRLKQYPTPRKKGICFYLTSGHDPPPPSMLGSTRRMLRNASLLILLCGKTGLPSINLHTTHFSVP